jgi:PAS domain S-box-containing protein
MLQSYVHFFCFILYTYVYLWILFSKKLNQTVVFYAITFFSYSLWSLGYTILKSQLLEIGSINLIINIISITFSLVSSMTFLSVVYFLDLKYKKQIAYFVAPYILIFSYFIVIGFQPFDGINIQKNISMPFWGINFNNKNIIDMFRYFNILMYIFSILLLIYSYFFEKSKLISKQVLVMLIAISATFVLTMSNIYFYDLKFFEKNIVFYDAYMIIFAAGVIYNIKRNNFLNLDLNKFGNELFDYIPIGIVIMDKNSQIKKVNSFFSENFGYSLENLKDLKFEDILKPNDLNEHHEILHFETKIPIPIKYIIQEVMLKRNQIGSVHLFRDISLEVKRKEEIVQLNKNLEISIKSKTEQIIKSFEKIAKNEENFRILSETIPFPVVIINNNKFAYFNNSFQKFIGEDPRNFEKIDDKFLKVCPVVDGCELPQKYFYELPENSICRVNFVGNDYYLMISKAIIDYEGSNGYLISFVDLTEQIQIQNNLLFSKEKIEMLVNRLENLREEERNFLSSELHDNIGQDLILLKASALKISKNSDKTNCQLLINNHLEGINQVIGKVKNISRHMNSISLNRLDLFSSIERMCFELQNKTDIDVVYENLVKNYKVEEKESYAVLRIFQEAISNTIKHSAANKLDVKIVENNEDVIFIVKDNGVGFSESIANLGNGLGLISMKERAKAIGAKFEIISDQSGTTLIINVSKKNNYDEQKN